MKIWRLRLKVYVDQIKKISFLFFGVYIGLCTIGVLLTEEFFNDFS